MNYNNQIYRILLRLFHFNTECACVKNGLAITKKYHMPIYSLPLY